MQMVLLRSVASFASVISLERNSSLNQDWQLKKRQTIMKKVIAYYLLFLVEMQDALGDFDKGISRDEVDLIWWLASSGAFLDICSLRRGIFRILLCTGSRWLLGFIEALATGQQR